mmetsp:Transcript_29072/g.83521  ORF Transcript_29072/g.83521 Transcript_29072/m.83521 type:complete len:245 (+) Transcript_29072:677-1411(+)
MDGEDGPRHGFFCGPAGSTAQGHERHAARRLPQQLPDGHARAAGGLLAERSEVLGQGCQALLHALLPALLRALPLGRGHVRGPVPLQGPGGAPAQRVLAADGGPLRPARGLAGLQERLERGLPPLQAAGGLRRVPRASGAAALRGREAARAARGPRAGGGGGRAGGRGGGGRRGARAGRGSGALPRRRRRGLRDEQGALHDGGHREPEPVPREVRGGHPLRCLDLGQDPRRLGPHEHVLPQGAR